MKLKLVFWSLFCAGLTLSSCTTPQEETSPLSTREMSEYFEQNPDGSLATTRMTGLPDYMVKGLDQNQDGEVTATEYRKIFPGEGERDRSEMTVINEEGFPLNVNPEIVAPDRAELGDDDMVMGVVINGEARAYPVNYMNGPTNEVVNDILGGTPIAPSW